MICLEQCSVFPLQDALDAMGYFHLALAAALEDRANPEGLYVVYMKLAEIHGNHIPDAQLFKVYRDRAQSLKRALAGEEGIAIGEENMDYAYREDSDPGEEHKESGFISVPEDEKCEESSYLRTCVKQEGAADECREPENGDSNGKEPRNINPDADGHLMEASGSETETTTSQSYSNSLFTESFETAKEQMSDSSSSSVTLQTANTDGKEFEYSLPSHVAFNHTPITDSGIQHPQNTQSEKTDAPAAHNHNGVSQSTAEQAETAAVNTDKAAGVDISRNTQDDRSRDAQEMNTWF